MTALTTPEHRLGLLIGLLVVLFGVVATWQLGEAVSRDRLPDRPLQFTACDPDTYQVPAAGDGIEPGAPGSGYLQGPKQNSAGCSAVVAGTLSIDDLAAGHGISVAGQVCNVSDQPLSAIVSVEWVALNGTRVPSLEVADLPITYEAGCYRPYQVEWQVPPEVITLMREDPAMRWRIVGTADLVDAGLLLWDSIPTFAVE